MVIGTNVSELDHDVGDVEDIVSAAEIYVGIRAVQGLAGDSAECVNNESEVDNISSAVPVGVKAVHAYSSLSKPEVRAADTPDTCVSWAQRKLPNITRLRALRAGGGVLHEAARLVMMIEAESVAKLVGGRGHERRWEEPYVTDERLEVDERAGNWRRGYTRRSQMVIWVSRGVDL